MNSTASTLADTQGGVQRLVTSRIFSFALHVTILLLAVGAFNSLNAQTTYNWNGTGTNWDTSSAWTPGGPPSTSGSGTGVTNNNIAQIPTGTLNNSTLIGINLSNGAGGGTDKGATLGSFLIIDGAQAGSISIANNSSGQNGVLTLLGSTAGIMIDNQTSSNFALLRNGSESPAFSGPAVKDMVVEIGANGTFRTQGTGGIVITAPMTGTGNLTIAGAGATNPSVTGAISATGFGTASGTYNGAVVLMASTSLGNTGGVGASKTSTISETGSTTVANGGYLSLGSLNALANTSSITVETGGQLQLGTTAGGTYDLGVGTVTLNGVGPANAATPGALVIGSNVNAGTTHIINDSIALNTNSTINTVGATNVLQVTAPGTGISGAGTLTKIGSGTLLLSTTNSYSGGTVISAGTLELGTGGRLTSATNNITVNSGGTLLFSGTNADKVNNSAAVTLAGGTISTEGVTGVNETMGVLTLSGDSTIDFGDLGNNFLNFAQTTGSTWTGTLSIWDWNVGSDHLFFGNDQNGLGAAGLSRIQFYTGDGTGGPTGAKILTSGEVVAVPEPSSLLAGLGLLSLAAYRERRWFLRCSEARSKKE